MSSSPNISLTTCKDKPLLGDNGNLLRYTHAENSGRTNELLSTEVIPTMPGKEDETMHFEGYPTAEEQREASELWEDSQAGNFENGPESWTPSDWDNFNRITSAREAAVGVLEQLAG